jgi:hypothetical protein
MLRLHAEIPLTFLAFEVLSLEGRDSGRGLPRRCRRTSPTDAGQCVCPRERARTRFLRMRVLIQASRIGSYRAFR